MIQREDGWKAFRITGTLDFSLIGIGIFVISTFNTGYVTTKEKAFADALRVLQCSGYRLKHDEEEKTDLP